jgi:hypothetical protein
MLLSAISLFCLPAHRGSASASSLGIEVKGTLIDIQADHVPVIEILKSLSDKTGLVVETGDPLENPISLKLKDISLEKCLQRLLIHQNYALTYAKTGDDFVPISVRIIGTSLTKRLEPEPAAAAEPPRSPDPAVEAQMPQDDHMKKYQKSWFAIAVEDSAGLAGQIDTETLEANDADMPGLRIKAIAPESLFYMIGLREEDHIQEVNGKVVKTAKELIETLQRATGETLGMIRIARADKNPIYIELH